MADIAELAPYMAVAGLIGGIGGFLGNAIINHYNLGLHHLSIRHITSSHERVFAMFLGHYKKQLEALETEIKTGQKKGALARVAGLKSSLIPGKNPKADDDKRRRGSSEGG